jgi:lysophospholipase L1-like esterase
MRRDRSTWLVLAVLGFAPYAGGAESAPPAAPPIVWHDVAGWGVEGRLWEDEPRGAWFERFPAAAKATVPAPVWDLSRHSAGMMTRFRTDATAIHVRVALANAQLAMPHMAASGVSGVDLYARDDAGRWRWVAAAQPKQQAFEAALVAGLAPGSREYAAYLPLYNGVESLAIGVPEGAAFEGLAPRRRPIVFYGTSITHGACASRPGMTHVAILGRRLDRPVANLGFSGNGRMDAAVGDLLARVDAACFVIDCLPNMNAAQVRERCVPFVERLRAARPDVPIVLVEDRLNTNSWILPGRARHHAENHAALREAFDALKEKGVANLHYLPGDDLLGDDAEGTVDASHPNDLGFMRQADAFEPVLRAALQVDMPRATSGAK